MVGFGEREETSEPVGPILGPRMNQILSRGRRKGASTSRCGPGAERPAREANPSAQRGERVYLARGTMSEGRRSNELSDMSATLAARTRRGAILPRSS